VTAKSMEAMRDTINDLMPAIQAMLKDMASPKK